MRTIASLTSTDYLDSMDAWTPVIPVILLFAWTHGFLSHPETPMASMDSMESSRDNDIHIYIYTYIYIYIDTERYRETSEAGVGPRNQMDSKLLIDSIDYMDAAIP